MIKQKLTVLLILLCAGAAFSQKYSPQKKIVKENRYSIQLRYQFGKSFLQNPLVIFDNCVNCIRTNQEPVNMQDVDFTFIRRLNKLNAIYATTGYSVFGFQNDHFVEPTQVFFEDYTMRFYFYSLGAGHLLTLRPFKFLHLNLGNSLLWDINTPHDDYLIKRHNLSYRGSLDLELFPKWRLSLISGLFFKHAITNYNRIRFNRDYYPYNYGLLLGLKFNFDYRRFP